jgi:hypothetical protein
VVDEHRAKRAADGEIGVPVGVHADYSRSTIR